MIDDDSVDDVAAMMSHAMYNALLGGADHWAKLNLTMPQLKVLMLLGHHGSAAVSWLASRMDVSPPNVTGILDRLEQHGWVLRTNDTRDRRVVRVVLAAAGQQLLQDLHRTGSDEVREILAQMKPDDCEALRRGLAAFLSAATYSPMAPPPDSLTPRRPTPDP